MEPFWRFFSNYFTNSRYNLTTLTRPSLSYSREFNECVSSNSMLRRLFTFETIYATICKDSQNLLLTMGEKNFFAQGKYRVRWKNNAVFSLEKTVLDRIPLYKRTVLKEECLYIQTTSFNVYICKNPPQMLVQALLL